MDHVSKGRLTIGAITAWSGILIAGVLLMADRDTRPAETRSALREWPSQTSLVRSRERSNVIVFVHPQCPCTRATLRELERAVSRCGELASFQVVMCIPDGAPAGFARTDLWEQAQAIPGVRVSAQSASVEARRFGVHTSGEVLVFDKDGRLRFQGGITGSRGHEGDNAGRDALIASVQDGPAVFRTSPEFGCSLFDDEGADGAPAFNPNETTP